MKIKKDSYFENIKGYKLADGHFELGSNLHIDNYFYAKRLFYNSFYTNRFAFLLCKYIIQEFDSLIKGAMVSTKGGKKTNKITLLGYENYSELLVSSVRKMLNDYVKKEYGLRYELFNHDIFTKDSLFLKNPDKISSHAIQIFPISTTFSTSIKVQNEIKQLMLSPQFDREVVFYNPVLNCLLIANDELLENKTFEDKAIERDFGWQRSIASQRKIEITPLDKHYSNELRGDMVKAEPIYQRYFVGLHTKWSKINDCEACYPGKPLESIDEKCLIETKASALTPNVVFGYPKSFAYAADKNLFHYFNLKQTSAGLESVVYRKHFKRYGNHYIYYIRAGKFLSENMKDVLSWLETGCAFLDEIKDKNVVIITPTLGSNSGFANLLNDVVFSDTATIIQYNPQEEYLQNFKLFYCDILQNANSVLYVDDVLATTKSLSDINAFVLSARDFKAGIDYSISLVNRVGYYSQLRLDNELQKPGDANGHSRAVSFITTNVMPIVHRDKYPFVALMEKYDELSTKSVLDGMRFYFKAKERHFRPVDLDREHGNLSLAGGKRALLQFLMEHELMKLFQIEINEGVEKYRFENIIKLVFEPTDLSQSYIPVINFLLQSEPDRSIRSFIDYNPEFAKEIKYTLFKICSIDPYVQHKQVKSVVFNWVLCELIDIVGKIRKKGKVDADFFVALESGMPVNFSPYESFNFLLKRAAKLKINYIYSLELMQTLQYIIEGIVEYKRVGRFKITTNQKLIPGVERPKVALDSVVALHPIDFITFYVGLLQELIIEHESKALQVVVNVKMIIDANLGPKGNKKTLKNSYNDHFIHLLRLLVFENTFIFHSSSDKFLEKINMDIGFNYTPEQAKLFVDKINWYHETYPFLYNRLMLSRFDPDKSGVQYKPEESSVASFRNMMLLKAILRFDQKMPAHEIEVPIEEKLLTILKLSCDILDIKSGGAFIARKYRNRNLRAQQDDVAIIGHYSSSKSKKLKPEHFGEDSFLYKVFDGIKETSTSKPLSTFEITFDTDGLFHFRNNMEFNYENCAEYSEFQEELFESIFFLRVTEIEDSNEEEDITVSTQAVLCFYDRPVDKRTREKFKELQSRRFGSSQEQKVMDFSPKPGSRNYQRFDPKKVRQLLLLRNDLGAFINHHLDNDSLRAYIEMINNNRYSLSLSHGTSIYESSIQHYIEAVKSSGTKTLVKQNVAFLEILFRSLTNKVHLIAMANRSFKEQKHEFDNHSKEFTIADLKFEIEQTYGHVLTMEEDEVANLDSLDSIEFDSSDISDEKSRISFYMFPDLFQEMVFELLYNIKKHAVQKQSYYINNEGLKLRIVLSVIHDQTGTYFKITNNLCQKVPSFFGKMSKRLTHRRDSDGLNLIYNLIYRAYNMQLYVEGGDGLFTVVIPLKTN